MIIKIYLTAEKEHGAYQIISPTNEFQGDIHGLIHSIVGGPGYGYEILK